MRMSVIELKSFLFTLITNFTFSESPDIQIGKANVYVFLPPCDKPFADAICC